MRQDIDLGLGLSPAHASLLSWCVHISYALLLISNLDVAIDEMEAAGASLLISTDFNGLNSGVVVFKNSSWSQAFLAEAETARPLLATSSMLLPLKYENRAFFYLMDMWPSCSGLCRPDAWFAPRYASKNFRGGMLVVDRCLINRHAERPAVWHSIVDSGSGFDQVSAESGAFVAHCPGGTSASKHEAMARLLQHADVPPTSNNLFESWD